MRYVDVQELDDRYREVRLIKYKCEIILSGFCQANRAQVAEVN
jgi:hypothetical protein